jgi:hypothetical protein
MQPLIMQKLFLERCGGTNQTGTNTALLKQRNEIPYMNIGKLYQAKNLFWLLFPSCILTPRHDGIAHSAFNANALIRYWTMRFQCNVSFIEPKSMFVCLEQDGECCKVLTDNGAIGWICPYDYYKSDIQEVNQ